MRRNNLPTVTGTLLGLAAAASPSIALAHAGAGGAHGFSGGALHPLTGLDHVCAMIAIGLWAAQVGGRARQLIPLSFLSVFAVGSALGMAGTPWPLVEPSIAASVVVIGLLLAAGAGMPLAASAALAGCFALVHGHAHGAEAMATMGPTAGLLAYGLGFTVAASCLLAVGVGAGSSLRRGRAASALRWAGAAVAGCGLYLCAAL
jgi:urease accessory protein